MGSRDRQNGRVGRARPRRVASTLSVLSALLAVIALAPASTTAAALNATTSVSVPENPVTLRPGIDLAGTTFTDVAGATHPSRAAHHGKVVLEMAVDNAAQPVAAASATQWVAVRPAHRPHRGVTSFRLNLDALGLVPGGTAGFRAHYLPGNKRPAVVEHYSVAVDVVAAGGPPETPVARVVVMPGAALLTAIGETMHLDGQAFSAGDDLVTAPISWTSSRPDVVSVDAAGTITAGAFGSAQISGHAGTIESQPVLVVVATPAEGTLVVSDDQILSGPEADASKQPSFDNVYRVVMSGVSPAVGQLVVGTGDKALAGRVADVATNSDGTVTVTIRLVPLSELLPDLSIDESLDLSRAPVAFPAAIADRYDIERHGNTYSFTPKAAAATTANRRVRTTPPASLDAAGIGTTALPPFTDCESELTTTPISISTLPTMSVTVSPSVDVVSSGGHLERFVLAASPSVSVKAGVQVDAAFEGRIKCTAELFVFQIPVGGALSFFVGGLVPVGVGFEIAGKVTVASLTLGSEELISADAEMGVVCPDGANCAFHRELTNFTHQFTPTIDGPSLSDARLEPSLEVFAFLKLGVGNPFLTSIRFDAFEADVGLKLEGSWAPRLVQILDAEYASSYGLSLNVVAKASSGLDDAIELLGLDSIIPTSLEQVFEVAASPTGTVIADKASYETGDTAHVKVTLEPSATSFLGLYNVDRVVLVRYSGGSQTTLGTLDATTGQQQFGFDFAVAGPLSATDLYAFVVTKLPPLDLFALELGQASPVAVTVTPETTTLAPNGTQQFTALVTGTTTTAVAWSVSCGSITSGGLYTAPAGPASCTVTATSPEFSTSLDTAEVTVTAAPAVTVSVSPETAFVVKGQQKTFSATVTGAVDQTVTWAAECGDTAASISSSGVFTAPNAPAACTVTATSAADMSAHGSSDVTVGEGIETYSSGGISGRAVIDDNGFFNHWGQDCPPSNWSGGSSGVASCATSASTTSGDSSASSEVDCDFNGDYDQSANGVTVHFTGGGSLSAAVSGESNPFIASGACIGSGSVTMYPAAGKTYSYSLVGSISVASDCCGGSLGFSFIDHRYNVDPDPLSSAPKSASVNVSGTTSSATDNRLLVSLNNSVNAAGTAGTTSSSSYFFDLTLTLTEATD